MVNDIVPELLKKIQNDFDTEIDQNKIIAGLYEKVREGAATYLEADEYALEIGNILAESFKKNISADILPDGKMHYNIAKRILDPTLKSNYELITEVTKQVQGKMNKNAGIGIKAIKPELNQDRVDGLVEAVSSAEEYSKVMRVLDEPVKNFSQSIVTDSIKANAEFQHGAGLSPKIQRTAEGKCCKWCQNLARTYDYPNVPREVYQRHDYCRCKVDYVVGKERTNVHNNNTGKRKYKKDKYGTYAKIKEQQVGEKREKRIQEYKKMQQIDKMSISDLRKYAKDIAVEYYKTGASGISFPKNVDFEKAAEALAESGTRTSLKKDIISMQKKLRDVSANVLENTGESSRIKLQDIFIRKSVGAKSRNYDILDPRTGEIFHFAEGTRIQNPEVFAGKGVRKPLHEGVAEGLSEQCGGTPEKWQHCKGDGIIDWYGEERPAEVHWFQEESVGKVKFKVKEWLDEG